MKKYIKGSGDLPEVKTLREVYMLKVAEVKFEEIKFTVKGKGIIVFSDESTDKGSRCVYNIFCFKLWRQL